MEVSRVSETCARLIGAHLGRGLSSCIRGFSATTAFQKRAAIGREEGTPEGMRGRRDETLELRDLL